MEPTNDTTIRSVGSAVSQQKNILVGTHRVCTAEETLSRILPFLSSAGITRVAEVTQLDCIGIPVYQAIRPTSRTLSVSQGKGVTKELAKVSAIMESLETWHAENPILPSVRVEIGEMAPILPYSVYNLNLVKNHLLHDALSIDWFQGNLLGSSDTVYIPKEYINLDITVKDQWLLPTFFSSSNGLASGNVKEEAILHGLYEVIERDALTRAAMGEVQRISVDPRTVNAAASGPLIEQLYRADISLEILYLPGPTGIPCFTVDIHSPDYAMPCGGHGCHLDRDVALSRALTEAAQSRLTYISGARDDLDVRAYELLQEFIPTSHSAGRRKQMSFQDIPTMYHPDLATDLREVIARVLTVVDVPPIVVDLTRPEFGIPVIFVVVAGLIFGEGVE